MSGMKELKFALMEEINGYVYDADDDEFRDAIKIDNGRVSLKPGLIVVPFADRKGSSKNAAEAQIQTLIGDVAKTVSLCQKFGVQLTVKSGGHSAAGYCMNDGGVVLDIRNLDWNFFDEKNKVLRAGVGQTFSQVYDYLETTRSGYIPVGGGCPTVGLAGFLLGAGYSFLSRSYGMGCDNVLSFTVVCADGEVRTVSEKSKDKLDRELFWGLRGGGGGNFGVVVGTELQCHKPNNEDMLFGNILFPLYRFKEILKFYNEWIVSAPKELAVYGYIGSQPDPRMDNDSALMARFTVIYNGSFSDGVKAIEPLLELKPVSTQFFNMTLPEWEDLIGYGTVVSGRSAYIRSVVMEENTMTEAVAEIFMKHMIRRPSKYSFIVWTHAGAAVSEKKSDETAYPHRKPLFIPEVKAIWSNDSPDSYRKNVEWAYQFYEELAEHGCGAYINYIDPLQRGWREKYYADNYDRLCKLKADVDPTDFFSFQQSIGSDFEPVKSSKLDLSPLLTSFGES